MDNSQWDGSSGTYLIHGYTLDAKPWGYFLPVYGYFWMPNVTGEIQEWGRKVLDASSERSIKFAVDFPCHMPTGVTKSK